MPPEAEPFSLGERWLLRIVPFTRMERFVRNATFPFFRPAPNVFPVRGVDILIRCGIGDLLSFMARLPHVTRSLPDKTVRFWMGGFQLLPYRMRDLAFRDPRVQEVVVLRGYSGASSRRAGKAEREVRRRLPQGSVFLNWLEPSSATTYSLKVPYALTLTGEERKRARAFLRERRLLPEKTLVFQCATRHGNSNPDEEDRFWSGENFQKLALKAFRAGYRLVTVGLAGDNRVLPNDGRRVFSAEGLDLFTTAALLEECGGFIGTNSFAWEIVYRAGKPTFCFFLKHHHWIPVHAPKKNPPWLWVQKEKTICADHVWRLFSRLRCSTRTQGRFRKTKKKLRG